MFIDLCIRLDMYEHRDQVKVSFGEGAGVVAFPLPPQ